MTVVPVAFQLASWIPRMVAGGCRRRRCRGPDGPRLTSRICCRCAMGLSRSPHTARTRSRSSAGSEARDRSRSPVRQAVIVHRGSSSPSSLVLATEGQWEVVSGNPARPIDLSLDQTGAELAQAVVRAEHGLRKRHSSSQSTTGPPRCGPCRPARRVRAWPTDPRSPHLDRDRRGAREPTDRGTGRCAARRGTRHAGRLQEPLVSVHGAHASDRRMA